MSDSEPSIVLGVPGKWKNRSDIVTSIAGSGGGYIFSGGILMHVASGKHFEMEIYDHDASLPGKVRSGGLGLIPEEDLIALEDHTFTLYLVSDDVGRTTVQDLMDAAVALLDAGGLVVKVETSGFSVSAAKWKEHTSVKAAYSLYRSMVGLIADENEYFTCGMGVFALPDCVVMERNLEVAFEISTEFCCYLIDEAPNLADGHTFGIREGAPRYRLSFESYDFYPPGDM